MPIDLWPDLRLDELGVCAEVEFDITPIVYETVLKEKGIATAEGKYKARLFPKIGGSPKLFMNGTIGRVFDENGAENAGVAARISTSLLENDNRIFFRQEVGTLKVFRNCVGVHARDLFQDQQIFAGMTRLLLRPMSASFVEVGRRV